MAANRLFENHRSRFVIPAKAGIQAPHAPTFARPWTPAFAGVTGINRNLSARVAP
jgi:hypothetical protein